MRCIAADVLIAVIAAVGFMLMEASAEESAVLQFPNNLTPKQVHLVEQLRENYTADFLSHPMSGEAFAVLLPAAEKGRFQNAVFQLIGRQTKDVTEKVARDLAEKNAENDRRRDVQHFFNQGAPLDYYATLSEVYSWMQDVARENPCVELAKIGRTHEQRDMLVLKLNAGKNLPILFVESGIHAREWLSPASAMYMVDKILKGAYLNVLSRYELHFLLVANPDGYEHTHQYKHSLQGRFWRKNRRASQYSCVGADLNRNFDIHFGKVGVSHNCNSDIYPGTHGFSEPETSNERNYLLKIANRTRLYLSIHTFGQMVIVPYCYTTHPPADDAKMRRIGQAAINAFKATGGKQFHLGTPQQLGLGVVSGSSVDWVKDVAKISNAFAFELQPRGVDAFNGGFNPPSSYIRPSGEEALAAFVAMVQTM